MSRPWRILALGVFGLLAMEARMAKAQIVVTGGRAVVAAPGTQVVQEAPVPRRLIRRSRNPYFAARPVYSAVPPGTRAKVTFEPFTRWYYPNSNSYYPPVDSYPSIRTR